MYKSTTPCRFFAQGLLRIINLAGTRLWITVLGRCRYGYDCRFSHTSSESVPTQIPLKPSRPLSGAIPIIPDNQRRKNQNDSAPISENERQIWRISSIRFVKLQAAALQMIRTLTSRAMTLSMSWAKF